MYYLLTLFIILLTLSSSAQGATTTFSDADTNPPVTAIIKVLTRVKGVSPETVYFSAMDSTSSNEKDIQGGNDQKAIAVSKLTYHFNFNDSDSGYFNTTGRSRNQQISSGSRAIHTFHCNGSSDPNWDTRLGLCLFNVGVRVQDTFGDYDDDFIQVSIQSQEDYYSADDTICVSSSSEWFGCPDGATHLNDTPPPGEFSGKRVLYQRGSTQAYSDIKISHGAKNVTIDTYGEGSRPLVYRANIGYEFLNDTRLQSFEMISKDANGYIVSGLAYDITITGLRLGTLDGGRAVTLMTAHDLDMDWSTTPNNSKYGRAYFASLSNSCIEEDDFTCTNVHYPYGSFITDSVIKGYPESLPLINIGCFHGCSIINSGMAGVEVKISDEHNSRIMGSWGLVVADSWFRGDHLGGPGAKAKLTIRVPGFGDTADQLNTEIDPEDFDNGGHLRGSERSELFIPRYATVVNNWINDSDQSEDSVSGAFVGIDKYHKYSGIYGNKIISDPVTAASGKLAAIGLGGIHIYSIHNDIPTTYAPCTASLTDVEGYHDRATIYAIADSWEGFNLPEGSQCRRIEAAKVIPDAPVYKDIAFPWNLFLPAIITKD